MKYEEADASCKLILEISPELTHSICIYYVAPSKKALRRFPCADVAPRVPENTVPAYRKLSDRIHRAVVEVADLGLRELPGRTMSLEQGLALRLERQPCRAFQECMRRRFQSNSADLVSFMRRELPMRSYAASAFVGYANGRSKDSIKWPDPGNNFLDPISERMALPSSSFVRSQENPYTLSPTVNGSDLTKPFMDRPVPDVLVVPTSSPRRSKAGRSFPRRVSERLAASFLWNEHKR
jgi:hypothetical protein